MASSMLWVTNSMVLPSAPICAAVRSARFAVWASSAANGSSMSSTSGSKAKARAMATAAHAAGELRRVAIFETLQPTRVTYLYAHAAACDVELLHLQTESHIVEHRAPGNRA